MLVVFVRRSLTYGYAATNWNARGAVRCRIQEQTNADARSSSVAGSGMAAGNGSAEGCAAPLAAVFPKFAYRTS
jgi:hypothetical protein